VNKLQSILVVVERKPVSHYALLKGYMLARHCGARLELFMCDAEHAFALRHAYDRRGTEHARSTCLADGRRFVESMRQSVAAQDVPIDIDVACESPLYEGIVRKVLAGAPDLVIKAIGGDDGERTVMTPSDWQLARTCPVPLMLTRGRTWSVAPRIVAAVDVSVDEPAGMARAIVSTAQFLATGCSGELDIVYSEQRSTADVEAGGQPPESAKPLLRLAKELGRPREIVHVLQGDPETTLPGFAARHRCDLLVLGALMHRESPAALVGSLTSRLMECLDCDFVLVKPESYSCPVRPRPDRNSREIGTEEKRSWTQDRSAHGMW
jgi:universal stress protein E